MCLSIQRWSRSPRLLFAALSLAPFFPCVWKELSCEAIWWKLETSIAIRLLSTGGTNMASHLLFMGLTFPSPKQHFWYCFCIRPPDRDEPVVSDDTSKSGLIVSRQQWALQTTVGVKCPLSDCLFMSWSGENLLSSKRTRTYFIFTFFFLF